MSDLKVSSVAPAATEERALRGQLLVLVLDINPNHAFFARSPKYMIHWLDAALALVNSHLMLETGNSVAAVAAHASGCSYLYPAASEASASRAGPSDGQFEGFQRVESCIRREVLHILARETEPGAPVSVDSLLSGALCKALAYINRKRAEAESTAAPVTSARVLVR